MGKKTLTFFFKYENQIKMQKKNIYIYKKQTKFKLGLRQ